MPGGDRGGGAASGEQESPEHSPGRTLAAISLGCAKNTVDTEQMLGLLTSEGFTLVAEPADADLILLNTCCFIDPATEESRAALRKLCRLRRQDPRRRLIVAGCMPMRWGRELLRSHPEIDVLLGTRDFGRVGELSRSLWDNEKCGTRVSLDGEDPFPPAPRLRFGPVSYAYLKVSEGCDHGCGFCIVPRLRGRQVSRTRDEIEKEAEALVTSGARELVLVAQDTTGWGRDRTGRARLPHLLCRLAKVPGVRWLRVMYAHPSGLTAGLAEALAAGPPICRYLDVPLQHISPRVLRAMGRPADARRLRAKIARLVEDVPGITLRTTFLVGFPGEEEDDFRRLLDFVDEGHFERVGAFAFSPQEESPAARLPRQVPPALREERYHRLMERQQHVSRCLLERRVGREVTVLVTRVPGEPGFDAGGRTEGDAPEIDGLIHLRGKGISPGTFLRARVTGARTYDLEGDVVGPG